MDVARWLLHDNAVGRHCLDMLLVVALGAFGCSTAAPPEQPGDVVPPLVDVSECSGPQCPGEAPVASRPADLPIALRAVEDGDGDGVSDADDQCPELPEDEDGYADEDGCPDYDNDDDGIPDAVDQCPAKPENVDGFKDDDGCPDTKTDRAKAAFTIGMEAYRKGDYAAARRHFEAAYALEPRDPMLFNLAQAALRQGDMAAACRYHRLWKATPRGQTSPSNPTLDVSCP